MHIPKGHEMELLEESLTDGPGSLNHVAVCKQERLSFAQPLGLVQNGEGEGEGNEGKGEGEGEGQGEGEGDSSEELEEQGGQDPPRKKSHTISRQRAFKSKPELQRQGDVSHSGEAEFPSRLWHSASAGGPDGAGRGCPAGVSSPSGRQVVGKADSWPHNAVLGQTLSATSKSDACLHTAADAGGGQPPREPREPQRRVSQEFDPEKTTHEFCPRRRPGGNRAPLSRRKIKVYPPENESAIELPISRSAECESMFIGTLFDDNDSKNSDFLSSSFSLDTEAPGLDCAEASMVSAAGLEAGLKRSLGLTLCTDQEKRRFSASELMNRLQLSQRKMAQALKLPKSLSARSPSREKNASNSLTSEGTGKCCVKEKTRSLTSAECLVFQQLQSSGTLSADSLLRSLEKPVSHSREEEEDTGETQLRERRHSRFLQNCEFMPAILYQEYSNVASDREIQRQKRADTVTEDEDATATAGSRRSLSHHNSIRSQRSSRGSAFVLWQDIPGVRSSGLLDVMGNEQRKLQEAKFELVTSEGSYLCSLTLTVEHFQNSKELQECLNSQEKQWLFSKLPEVKEVSEKFLQELEDRVERDILRFDVCDIVLTHSPAFRRVYLPYVTNQAYQEQTYQRLLQENPKFPGVLAKLEEDPKCQRLPLTSFLILPFQRIMRLKMLVENILKRTAQGSQDEDAALKAFNELKKVTAECNCSVQSMKRTEELIHLNKKIHFESKIFPLISQSRWLVKHGELTEVDTQTNNMSGSKFKLSTKPIYLHLFNDCLLLSRKKDTGKFAVFVHAKIHELKAKDLNVKVHGIPGHVFHLQLFEKHHLKQQILLRARTESEKQRWITATLLTHQETDSDLIEVEKEDSPQVQCIKAYKAQEHDELTLEKADVFQVKTKTKDGWIEGVRLSDGDKGWFPTSHVEEIRNRHARMRNLRDKNRIKCATQKLQGQSS